MSSQLQRQQSSHNYITAKQDKAYFSENGYQHNPPNKEKQTTANSNPKPSKN